MRRQRLERTLAVIGGIGALIILAKGLMLVLYYGKRVRFPAWVKIIV